MSTPTIKIAVSQADAVLVQSVTLTSGMTSLPVVKFTFTEEWNGLGKTAIVRAGSVVKDLLITNNQIIVPYECLETSGVNLIIGVYGTDAVVVIPTVWCACGEILDGTDYEEADNVGEATATLVDQMLDYAEDIAETAEILEEYAITGATVDDTAANNYGTADVQVSLDAAGEERNINFVFSNLKGNGVTGVEFSNSGEYKGRIVIKTNADPTGASGTFDGLVQPLANIETLENRSQAYAIGTMGEGTSEEPVPSDDPAYHNSSKYYAQQAGGYADSAEMHAGFSRDYAESAHNSRAAAQAAKTAAETAQEYAETAAYDASLSRDSASASATSASASETNAASSASQAASSATSAAASETSANASATSANSSATSASASATSASSSATSASGSASSASSSSASAAVSASSASADALKAEGHAVGKQNGSNVGSSSPYYHNNAKYYADLAGTSAENKVYWVTYGTTTHDEVDGAIDSGLLPVLAYGKRHLFLTASYNISGGHVFEFNNAEYNGNTAHASLIYTTATGESTWQSGNDGYPARNKTLLTTSDITTNLTTADKAAEAKATGDAIATKADKAVEDTLKTVTDITPSFAQGGINSTTGKPSSSSTRCRGDAYYVVGGTTTITVPGVYRYAVYFYNSESPDDYIGSTYTDDGWSLGNRTITANDGKYFRIVVVWQNTSSAITPEDITGVTFSTTKFVDDTLSEIGKAADAKAVGDQFNITHKDYGGLSPTDDLDEITQFGSYRWTSSNTPINSPTSGGARMIVIGSVSALSQIVITSDTIFVRARGSSGFGDWTSFLPQYRSPSSRGSLDDNTDLDTVSANAMYNLASNYTYPNSPRITGYSARLIVINISTGAAQQVSGCMQIVVYADGYIYIRYCISTGWLAWRRILTNENLDKQLVTFSRDSVPIGTIINSSSKWINKSGSSAGYMFDIPSGVKKVSMIVPKGAVIAFLQTYDATVDIAGATPNFCKRYPARMYLADAGRVEYRISDDTRYMYILGTSSTGVDVSPTYIRYHYTYVPEKLQELPVLYLTGDTSEMTKDNAVTLNYWLFGNAGTCTVKWQGSSSQRYVKKNYTIKFDAGFDGWNKWATFVNDLRSKNGNISTIPTTSRWGSRTKYCAKANWIDPSAARNIVGARLWGQIVKGRITAGDVTDGRTDAPNYGAVDGFPIEIVINNQSTGLYTLNIPKDSWQFAMGSGSSECILSAESNSVNACKWKALAEVDETDYSVEYASVDFETADIKASLNTAIQAALNADASWETDLAPYLDIDSVIDYFIFACCLNGTDVMAHNIIYGTYDGTKWFMSAYDLDTTFGVDPYGTKWMDVKNDRCQFAEVADFHRLAYLVYNYSSAKLKLRYQELRATVLSEANVWKELSNFIVDIPTYDYDVDRQIWPTTPGTALANISQYMEFYRMHCAYLDAEIAAL